MHQVYKGPPQRKGSLTSCLETGTGRDRMCGQKHIQLTVAAQAEVSVLSQRCSRSSSQGITQICSVEQNVGGRWVGGRGRQGSRLEPALRDPQEDPKTL